jgi:CheY-like chemotaxis protein
MSPETQAKIFDPFFTTKSGGHGFGLAVVQGIVHSLGGAIHVSSEPGTGTTFQILLPCVTTPSASAMPSAVSPRMDVAPPSREATILVAEDEDALRRAVATLLRKTGYSVVEASDGSAALQTIRENPVEFLVLDITLPGASSREVFEEARRLRPETTVIVTSAYSKDFADRSLQVRVEHFLRKPYRIGDLVDLLRRTG